MVLLIMSRDGYEEVRHWIAPSTGPAVWINAGVLSDEEIREFREKGVDLTTFTNAMDIDSALMAIADHHPGKNVWVEYTMPQLK